MIVLVGLVNLLGSKKAVMCLIILWATSILAYFGKLTDGYAAVVSVIATIYCHAAVKTEALEKQ